MTRLGITLLIMCGFYTFVTEAHLLHWFEMHSFSSEAPAVVLTEGKEKYGAACLDGSVPYMYVQPGSGDGVTKWAIYFEGGGWCGSLTEQKGCQDSCLHRSTDKQGSSESYASSMDMSSIDIFNGFVSNWNLVYLPYCDGASFSGNVEEPVNVTYQGNTTQLYFRGKRILMAVIDKLQQDYGLSHATEAIVSGGSAGGLASFLHGDWVLDQIRHISNGALVRSGIVPDCGFFMEYQNPQEQYESTMKWVFEAQNVSSSLSADCLNKYGDESWKCIFAPNYAPFIRNRVFARQSRFDSWQSECILGSDNVTLMNEFGRNLSDTLFINLIEPSTENGAFLDSCFHHCGKWNAFTINGIDVNTAIHDWFYQQREFSFFFQNQQYKCEECCENKFCSFNKFNPTIVRERTSSIWSFFL